MKITAPASHAPISKQSRQRACGRGTAGRRSGILGEVRFAPDAWSFPGPTMEVRPARCHRPRCPSRAPSRRACREEEALLRFWCERCGRAVLVCRFCDRGQIYCAGACARRSRQKSMRRAGARYRIKARARRLQAARQGRYRRRQREKVTHQGPPQAPDAGQGASGALQPLQEDPDEHLTPQSHAPIPPGPQPGGPGLISAPTLAPRGPVIPLPASQVCHFCRQTQSAFTRA